MGVVYLSPLSEIVTWFADITQFGALVQGFHKEPVYNTRVTNIKHLSVSSFILKLSLLAEQDAAQRTVCYVYGNLLYLILSARHIRLHSVSAIIQIAIWDNQCIKLVLNWSVLQVKARTIVVCHLQQTLLSSLCQRCGRYEDNTHSTCWHHYMHILHSLLIYLDCGWICPHQQLCLY